MTKLEYLKQLEAGLREKMSEQEIYDIMRDYAEYFEEGKTEGKTEDEIINSLGSPTYVVSQILCEQENPEARAESDDIIGAAKEKFRRIKLRMEENKKYNEQKKKERQQYENRTNYSGEYRSPEYRGYREPRMQKSENNILRTILLIILWIFIIIPFIMFVFSFGAGLVGASVAGVCGLAVASSFLLPITNVVGVLGVITLVCAGLTVLLLGVLFLRFCIRRTVSSEKEPASKRAPFEEHQTFYETSQKQEENAEEGEEHNA